ncbi:MAG: CRISPR-associated helicase Cas3' [Synergistaceae bacterium]|nr:CRISPR-associated helicase Cas3' [Synergistaceae bacterium]
MTNYYAHSKINGKFDLLRDHLLLVANRSKQCIKLTYRDEAYIAGLYHDIGKYGNLFIRRLQGLERGIDHWSAGASYVHKQCPWAFGAVMSIQGHHVGLGILSKNYLPIDLKSYKDVMPQSLRLSEDSLDILIKCMSEDDIPLLEYNNENFDYPKIMNYKICLMNKVRMIFSSLTDSDFIETEAHFNRDIKGERIYRSDGRKLNPSQLLEILNKYIFGFKYSKMSEEMRILRGDLLNTCNEKARLEPGLFTLSAPTGSGKTISMLYFGLKHALIYNKRRLIIVLPYLNIIEQTADKYREIFKDIECNNEISIVLEDHSLADDIENKDDDESKREAQRLLSQNWDAPIIITTNVQFFESIFSNSPFKCRKIHNIADSVILFDEVQSINQEIVIPTLAALSDFAQNYGCSVVFATATQPAFGTLHHYVKKWCFNGWTPTEIASSELGLFSRKKRVKVKWPFMDEYLSLEGLCKEIISCNTQSLCIVNTKNHAKNIFLYLKEFIGKNYNDILFHLSTNMTVEHRKSVLKYIKSKLKNHEPCILIATQCIEAGVDIDFPSVFRALAPLDAIAQAAGRCNRNGLLDEGSFRVFIPDKESFGGGSLYPSKDYRQGADILINWLKNNNGNIDIESSEIFERYFKELYSITDVDNGNKPLYEAIMGLDFAETSKIYQVINHNTSNLLVPYKIQDYRVLANEARMQGLSRNWIKRARKTSIGIYRPSVDSNIAGYIEPVKYRDITGWGETGWFIYLREEDYDEKIGLVIPLQDNCYIG